MVMREPREQRIVITAVSDKLVAMVALDTLDRLIGAYLSGDKSKFNDQFTQSRELILSERAKALLNEYRSLSV